MPYNNTPITPTKEITGTVALPLARVKKIIATDDDISNCSNNAAFMITVAAEMFLQHLVEQSYNIVKSEKKPRRNIQYRDIANAVARVENLEFLTDVVPKTTTYKHVKQNARKAPVLSNEGVEEVDLQNADQTHDREHGPGDQLTIENAMAGRTAPSEARAATYPQVVIPTSEAGELQAVNGAKKEDEMEVDDEDDVVVVSRPGTAGGKMEEV